MFRNYFITAFRNFWRNKAFSAINLLGLSVGISAALIIFLIVYHEFSYDQYPPDKDRIFRVVTKGKYNGIDGYNASVVAPLANGILQEVTGVDHTVPYMTFQGDGKPEVAVNREGQSKPVVFKKQENVFFTNAQYFALMPHQWLIGTPGSTLNAPFQVVLTESRAKQYFPGLSNSDIIGKSIVYNNDITAAISGIVKDLTVNSTLTAVEFISYATIAKTHLRQDFMMDVWNDGMAYSQLYLKLAPGITAQQTEKQLNALLLRHTPQAKRDAANETSFVLQPLAKVHFDPLYTAFNQRVAHLPTLYGLFAVACFLLLLGCINFINLTTANAAHRAKEIGIRKTMGGSRGQLIAQFLGETALITACAIVLSVLITPFLLTVFQEFLPDNISLQLFNQSYVWAFLGMLLLVVSTIAGMYPAFILSRYQPVLVLKSQAFAHAGETRQAWIRKTLTVSQFVIAQFFIIATLLVGKQIHYVLNADMGFRKEAILNMNLPGYWRDTTQRAKAEVFMNELRSIPGIALASKGFLSPATEGAAFGNILFNDGKKEIKENVQVRWGDLNYLQVYQIPLVAGRMVQPVDSLHECLINENYATLLGFNNPQQAIHQTLSWNNTPYSIVGVMKDFHQHSLHGYIQPIVYKYGSGDFLHLQLQPNHATWPATIAAIENRFKQLYPDTDFSYSFFDETIANFYNKEQQTAKLLTWATGLAIFISCLGLVGLVMYTTQTRNKEIGIRKILGASVTSIVTLLSKDFIQLVVLAFLIAAPIAWWAASKWLADFAYRTDLSWWVFLLAATGMLLVAMFTLGFQTIRAAMRNPAKSLRTE